LPAAEAVAGAETMQGRAEGAAEGAAAAEEETKQAAAAVQAAVQAAVVVRASAGREWTRQVGSLTPVP
jgi:hypothetical protein